MTEKSCGVYLWVGMTLRDSFHSSFCPNSDKDPTGSNIWSLETCQKVSGEQDSKEGSVKPWGRVLHLLSWGQNLIWPLIPAPTFQPVWNCYWFSKLLRNKHMFLNPDTSLSHPCTGVGELLARHMWRRGDSSPPGPPLGLMLPVNNVCKCCDSASSFNFPLLKS